MNQRGVPTISKAALRDHATPERIDRMWSRIDSDLGRLEVAPAPAHRWLVVPLAAAVAAFAGGLLVGNVVWNDLPSSPPLAALPRADTELELPAIMAAGSRSRTVELPGGGRITLSPGATVEVVRVHNGSLELRLVQGEASFDTVQTSSRQLLAIFAGEATVAARPGAVLHVRRNSNDLDVAVTDGQVDVSSPSGSQRLEQGQRADAIPIRRQAVAEVRPTRPRAVTSAQRFVARELGAPEVPEVTVAPQADWRLNLDQPEEAYRLLSAQQNGIAGAILSARSAADLAAIHEVAAGRDQQAALQALLRIVNDFPGDVLAQYAAFKVGNIYMQMKEPEKARMYFARAGQLEGELAEDAVCKQLRTATDNLEAQRLAQDYLTRYPNGRCQEDAQRITGGDDTIADGEDVVPEGPAEADAGSP